MRKETRDIVDPTQPALVVTYGNTTRKHRPLDTDFLVIGRSPFCDFTLNSIDVAPIHCIVARTDSGWRIKDCTGRGATRLNGAPVHDEKLENDDKLQIGSFTFEMHLPLVAGPMVAAPPPPAPDQGVMRRFEKVQRSRKRLGKKLLAMRSKLRLCQLRAQLELNRRMEQFEQRLHDYELRREQLERAERALSIERRKFDEDQERYQQQLDRIDRETEQKQQVARIALEAREEELEQRQRELDSERVVMEQHEREWKERMAALDLRAEELDQFAEQLSQQPQEPEIPETPETPETPEMALVHSLRELCDDLAQARRTEIEQLEEDNRELLESNAHLEERVRDRELQLARERAQLARERMEWMRQREEMHERQEPGEREPTLRDRLMRRAATT